MTGRRLCITLHVHKSWPGTAALALAALKNGSSRRLHCSRNSRSIPLQVYQCCRCNSPGLRVLLDPGSRTAPCLDEFLVGHACSLHVEQIYALSRYRTSLLPRVRTRVPHETLPRDVQDTRRSVISVIICYELENVPSVLFIVGIGIAEVILMIRIWVVCGGGRRLGGCMAALFLVFWIVLMAISCRYVASATFHNLPLPISRGCASKTNAKLLVIDWVIFLCFEMVLLCVTLVKSFQSLDCNCPPSRTSPLLKTIYRDGILFYLFTACISALNVAVASSFPRSPLLITPIGRTLHSILTTRLCLSLRQQFHHDDALYEESHEYLSSCFLSTPSVVCHTITVSERRWRPPHQGLDS